MPNLPHPPFEI